MDEKMDDKGDGAQLRKSLPAKLTNEPKNAPNSSSISSKSRIQKAKCVICSKSNKTKLPYCNACHKFAERVKQRDNSLVCNKNGHCPIGAYGRLDYCRPCRYRIIKQLDYNFAKGHNSGQNDSGQMTMDSRSGQDVSEQDVSQTDVSEHAPEASSDNVNSVNNSNYVTRKCEICLNMNYTRRPYCQACRKFAERRKKEKNSPVCMKKPCVGNGVSGSLNYCRACRYREILKLDRSYYIKSTIGEATESTDVSCDDSTSENDVIIVEENLPEQLMNSAPSGSGTNNGNMDFKTQSFLPPVNTHHNYWPMGVQPGSSLQSFNGCPYGPMPTNVVSSGREIMPASTFNNIFPGSVPSYYGVSPFWPHNISSSSTNGAFNAGQSIPRQTMMGTSSGVGANFGQSLLPLQTVMSTIPLAASSIRVEKNELKVSCFSGEITEYTFPLAPK